ncbi:Ectopic P granules protein 5-like protein, partial [Armadillidium nasatum]
EACSELEIDQVCANNLSLYRLGQQLINLPSNHIAYPSTAQMFLSLHLSRTPPQTGQFDCSSVFYKFYEGFINGNFLKKIKYSFSDALTFWESELAKEKNLESEESNDKQERRKKENFELWPELINKIQLNYEMDEHVRCWLKLRQFSHPSSPPSSISSSPGHSSGLSDSKEFHHRRSLESLSPSECIVKRLKEYDSPKPPPPLPSIVQKYSRTKTKPINRESILYDMDRYTDLIVSHSRNVNLKSKEMCATDCVFVELLPQLWANPVTKKVVSAKCTPKRNSKNAECSGPASIVVEYSEKRLNEGIKARLDQNREQYSSLYNSSIQAPSLQVCEAALQLEDLVNTVVSWHKSFSVDNDERMSLVLYGRELFYHFVKLTSEDTNAYPPAKQLITSCADALGQEFLHGHKDCQDTLIMQVLKSTPQFGVLLSPHFTPMVTPVETYLSNYSSLGSNISSHPDLCFMLLSKLYRVHLRAILNYNFPEHYAEILIQLLEISTMSAVKDTIALLASHFVHQRVEFGLYGLYSRYKSDVTPVVILMGMMSFTYILTASMTSNHKEEELGEEIWTNLEGLWTAWVAPLGGKARASCPQWIQELTLDKTVLLPWTPGNATNPAKAVGMFASTLAFFHYTYSDYKVLSMLLEYYHQTFASSAVKDHILTVLHSQLLSIPWHHLAPSLKDLEIFSKIIDEYLPECHSFIGNIFIQISWEKVVQSFTSRSPSSVEIADCHDQNRTSIEGDGNALTKTPVAKLHVLLLNILVRVSMEPSVRQSGLLHPLLLSACNFEWHVVDAKNFETVLNWFVMSCDPRIALEMDNRNPIDVSLISAVVNSDLHFPSAATTRWASIRFGHMKYRDISAFNLELNSVSYLKRLIS